MNQKFIKKLVVVTVIASTLACRMNIGGPTPERTVPVSTEALGQLDSALSTAFQADTNSITITVTEEQLTSFAAYRFTTNSDLSIQNPQIFLQNGQIEFYGQVEQGGVLFNAHITLQVYPDENGRLNVQITSIDLGPIPVTQTLQHQINDMVDQALSNTIESKTAGFYIQGITIANGKMVITATKQ
ncbi:MAG: LmeA family phospholipid-binding protein [Anaerolineales bacterium]